MLGVDKKLAGFWVMFWALAACSDSKQTTEVQAPITTYFEVDNTIRPQDDFYAFANNRWLQRVQAQGGKTSGTSIDEVRQADEQYLRELLKRLSETNIYAEGSDVWKLIQFYKMGSDSAKAEQAGLQPVLRLWSQIGELKSSIDLLHFLAQREGMTFNPFFSVEVRPNESRMGAWVLETPTVIRRKPMEVTSRDGKVNINDPMPALLLRAGIPEAGIKKEMATILKVEALLQKSLLAERKKASPEYFTIPELQELTPTINWPTFFTDLEIKADSIFIQDPDYLKNLEKMVSIVPLEEIKTYLRWTVLMQSAPYLDHATVVLSSRVVDANESTLNQLSRVGRSGRVLSWANEVFSDVIGKFYLRDHMTSDRLEAANAMIQNIKLALADQLKEAEHYPDSVRAEALKQLQQMTVEVANPTSWQSYSELQISSAAGSNFYDVVMECRRFSRRLQWEQIGKPIAIRQPVQQAGIFINDENKILITPAFLQSPFYYGEEMIPANYGAAGTDLALAMMQSLMVSVPALQLRLENGKSPVDPAWVLRQRELAAIRLAFEGLQRKQREEGRAASIDGLNGDQQFFVSYSVKNRQLAGAEGQGTMPSTAGRVNSILSQLAVFQATFGIAQGDRLYSEKAADEGKLLIY